MAAVSETSTMNVDSPLNKLSRAPMRVKMASERVKDMEAAGTKEPIWASKTKSATARV